MKKKLLKLLICACVTVALSRGSTLADTIYQSAITNGTLFAMGNGQEVGNEITVTPGSTWNLSSFEIEYFTPSPSLASDVGIDVRFYLNNGAVTNGFSSPGSVFFDSGWFYGLAGGNQAYGVTYNSSDFSAGWNTGVVPAYVLPGDFTFTVTFTNLDDANVIEMPLANSVTNSIGGTSYGGYWLNNSDGWTLMTNSAPANLVVDVEATPEPSPFGMAAIGGALLFGINRLRRKV